MIINISFLRLRSTDWKSSLTVTKHITLELYVLAFEILDNSIENALRSSKKFVTHNFQLNSTYLIQVLYKR